MLLYLSLLVYSEIFCQSFSASYTSSVSISPFCIKKILFFIFQSNLLSVCVVCTRVRVCLYSLKAWANWHIPCPWQQWLVQALKKKKSDLDQWELGPDFHCYIEKIPTYYFYSLHTHSSKLSKHVKHFHTSVLLQMLFHFLNEWRNPSVLPYVILAWIPKPYATIFNLISVHSLLFIIPDHWLSPSNPFFSSFANNPLTFPFLILK